jgi:hypothetical protein
VVESWRGMREGWAISIAHSLSSLFWNGFLLLFVVCFRLSTFLLMVAIRLVLLTSDPCDTDLVWTVYYTTIYPKKVGIDIHTVQRKRPVSFIANRSPPLPPS